MNRTQLIKWGFKLLCVIGLTIVMCTNIVNAQDKPKPKSPIESLTDDNFKKRIAKGFVLIKFTAPYQMASLDSVRCWSLHDNEAIMYHYPYHQDRQ